MELLDVVFFLILAQILIIIIFNNKTSATINDISATLLRNETKQ